MLDKVEGGSLATRLWLAPPTKMDQGSNVYLASAELASVAAVMGKLPTVAEHMEYANKIDAMAKDVYRYLNFDRMPEYTEKAATAKISVAQEQ